MILIRPATISDLQAITDIYNEAILNTTATFDTETKSVEQQKGWFNNHDAKHPIIVAEENGIVTGWASLTKWSDRCAYDSTAEVSVYVHPEHRNKGIGKHLMQTLMAEAKQSGLHTLIARITQNNDNSIHIHRSFGFDHVGVLREVGKKFGKYLDVHMMQKVI
jgi:phosphinothricin acetyltransferase